MNKNILLVGAGQLGSRHLQALANLDNSFNIYVVDPSPESLKLAEVRYAEVSEELSPKVQYCTSVNEILINSFFLSVIATNAAIRLEILKNIVNKFEIGNIILEKVLFQSIEQLNVAEELLQERNIPTWVNCPRRYFKAYQHLARDIPSNDNLFMTVEGDNWGLACNAIHFIDLWQFITKSLQLKINYSPDTYIVDSKREGYKELFGELVLKENNSQLRLICKENLEASAPLKITIEVGRYTIKIFEHLGEIVWNTDGDNVSETRPLKVLYQSELTNQYVMDILKSKTCNLTTFKESAILHQEFLNATSKAFSDITNISENIVPIT